MMIRTQIYISEYEHQALQKLKVFTGKSQSELIRSALDNFIKDQNFKQSSDEAFGMWKDNDTDFALLRDEWNRQ